MKKQCSSDNKRAWRGKNFANWEIIVDLNSSLKLIDKMQNNDLKEQCINNLTFPNSIFTAVLFIYKPGKKYYRHNLITYVYLLKQKLNN